ncbi:MAG: aldehyde dehydrogenase family protein [Parahaliea sp.]
MSSNSHIDTDEIQRVFELQSQRQWRNKQSTAADRVARLTALKAEIQRREEAVFEALYSDLRKDRRAAKGDLYTTYAELDDAIAHLEQWMQPEEVSPSPQFSQHRARITYESRGRVLLFGPWNFPLNLIFQPLTAIVAAGNCAVVKPNEMSPATSVLCAEIIRSVFDEADVAVMEGGVDLANRLLELPFDHIFFTGSPAVGKIVMAAAARHLASVTLELGGKNPVIVDRSADIAATAARIAVYRGMNSGQLCLCPELVWVPEESLDLFLETLQVTFKKSFYTDAQVNGDALGKIIDQRNFERVAGYIEDAVAQGATLVCGGKVDAASRTIEPSVVVNLPETARMDKEEVFGPILSVYTYREMDEVYRALHRRHKPLALYIFSRDDAFVDEVLANTSSGGVTVNDCLMHCVEHRLPFGGINHSGIGAYHGEHGFRELSHARSVLLAP